ncbi:MAG: 2-oxo acid dehydrogenase subunit E2 [Proteobacteria bacterium]|nr:2-oxo acid dehydrogenase subunit E2 [Pseudomonadota bacterium]
MSAPTDIRAPIEQEGTKAVVRKWLKKVGDAVRVDEPVVELETDKVAVEVAAEAAGVLAEIVLDAGADAEPGALLGRLSSEGAKAAPAKAAPAKAALESPATAALAAAEPSFDWPSHPKRSIASFDPALRLSPSVRRLLIEEGLDPTGMKGTGRDGRLTRADVEAAAKSRSARPSAPAKPVSSGGVTAIPHDSMRRRIAEHMVHSMTVAPHVTAVFEADFSRIMAHRRAHKAEFERQGVNLTYTAYLIAASAEAMKVSPNVNSRWFDDRLEVYEDANIGLGVALGDQGLIVPVIQKAQTLSLLEIARQLGDLTERARLHKLTPADVKGGTFSISNHGVSGSLVAAPIIINQPQSAILGVGKLEKRVVVREVDGVDTIQVRPMAYVSLTIDHRAIDGHQTNAWLTRFVEVLEGWEV